MTPAVLHDTAAKAFTAALARQGIAVDSAPVTPPALQDTSLEDWANTAFRMVLTTEQNLPELLPRIQPLTALQQAHADAKARAAKIASRETGVCSIYDLGEIIAGMENEANVYWAAHDSTAALALGKYAKQLKELIPALRLPALPKDCPHCGAKAQAGNEGGKIFVQCSNKASCPAWPQTQNKLSLEAATAAWNNNETR
ncbi:MAG: hypothetical protein EOP88_17170 [Verrucomicrobiaceae bacterium]|nr:MAG: hypothetical protein EOP88_17170 [Verrucomicrobiaceae bacterium]